MSHQEKRNQPSSITSGLILILLGVLFLLITLDFLSWSDLAAYFLLGLGIIFLVESFSRSPKSTNGKPPLGKILAGVILLVIGASHVFDYFAWWPLILIAVGLYLLIFPTSKMKAG
ncbi:MAG: hypothetical protein B5M54_03570 [Candidatus Aminicenantes bacterium 4484_214]|nr:MAG: hypothetical protein B5M54_03570 [Candidatus Aminicenantes bacterium 4484_214]RLE09753.1 MAG: hypothetical protein DRJ06_02295 [Candidatus Aminicenantes bacterium]